MKCNRNEIVLIIFSDVYKWFSAYIDRSTYKTCMYIQFLYLSHNSIQHPIHANIDYRANTNKKTARSLQNTIDFNVRGCLVTDNIFTISIPKLKNIFPLSVIYFSYCRSKCYAGTTIGCLIHVCNACMCVFTVSHTCTTNSNNSMFTVGCEMCTIQTCKNAIPICKKSHLTQNRAQWQGLKSNIGNGKGVTPLQDVCNAVHSKPIHLKGNSLRVKFYDVMECVRVAVHS